MDFQANYPIYLQIAEDVKRRIVIGELKPGDKLPSNAELAMLPGQPEYGTTHLSSAGGRRYFLYQTRHRHVFWRKIRQCRNACGRKSAKNSAPSS